MTDDTHRTEICDHDIDNIVIICYNCIAFEIICFINSERFLTSRQHRKKITVSTKDILTPENVNGIFRDCLFRDGEDTTDHVRADGVTFSVGFHPERLDGHRQEIEAMLSELPDSFKEGVDGGGGYSFLDACMNRHGNLWTGLHKTVEELILLGVAIGKVEFTLPREIWRALPGGMPYLSVKQ